MTGRAFEDADVYAAELDDAESVERRRVALSRTEEWSRAETQRFEVRPVAGEVLEAWSLPPEGVRERLLARAWLHDNQSAGGPWWMVRREDGSEPSRVQGRGQAETLLDRYAREALLVPAEVGGPADDAPADVPNPVLLPTGRRLALAVAVREGRVAEWDVLGAVLVDPPADPVVVEPRMAELESARPPWVQRPDMPGLLWRLTEFGHQVLAHWSPGPGVSAR